MTPKDPGSFTLNGDYYDGKEITEPYLQELPEGHIIRTFVAEHRNILDFLRELEKVREDIWQLTSPLDHPHLFLKLIHLADQLVATEKHHIREEEILFPELAKRGIQKYHFVLKSEHLFLRQYKKDFLDHVTDLSAMDFKSYKLQMNFMAIGIVGLLRGHILRENRDVFPMALEVVQDDEIWQTMRQASEKIGFYQLTSYEEFSARETA